MAFIKQTWVDRDVPYPDRREIHYENGVVETVDIKRAEGTPRKEGTQLNAATFNDLENRIATAFNDTAYSAGYGISIENNTISLNLTDADTQEY
jgi:hypothetical protein